VRQPGDGSCESAFHVIREGDREAFDRREVVAREGCFVIADKRTLRVHDGTTSVHHDKIIDPEVDADENLLIRTIGQFVTPEIPLACRDVPAEPAPSRSGSSSCFDRLKERRRDVR